MLLTIDLIFQGILFLGTVIAAFGTLVTGGDMGIFLGYGLLFLGGWQLGSGVIMGIILKDNLRAKYFFGSVLYLIMIVGLGNLLLSGGKFAEIFFGSVFITIIPLMIASWYLRLTNSTLNKLNEFDDVAANPEEYENILDSEEIFKPIER